MGCSLFSSLTRTLNRCSWSLLWRVASNIVMVRPCVDCESFYWWLVTGARRRRFIIFHFIGKVFISIRCTKIDWHPPIHSPTKQSVNKYESSQPADCALDQPNDRPQRRSQPLSCPGRNPVNPFNQQIKICQFHICTCSVQLSWVPLDALQTKAHLIPTQHP